MAPPIIKVTKARLLIVEGADEENLIGSLVKHWSISNVQILPIGGKDHLRPNLDAALAAATVKGITLKGVGVIRDADSSASGAFRSVSSALKSRGFPAPTKHAVFVGPTPSAGIFVAPDGTSNGAIEDLCWRTLAGTAVEPCCTAYLNCLKRAHSLPSKNIAKSLVHAYLASREEPSTTVGVGALKHYWDLGHAAFGSLRQFVDALSRT